MKLVRIDEDLYLNPEFVSSIEPNDDSSLIITMNNNDVFPANIPIKKVLDAISGSEEYRKSNAFIDEKGHLHNSHFKTNS